MKKYIACIAILMALSMPTQACSICKPVEKALKWMGEWLEASHCLSMRLRMAQITGGTVRTCNHSPKHDNAGSNEK